MTTETITHPTHIVEVHVGTLRVEVTDTDDPLLAALEATVRVKSALERAGVDDPHAHHKQTWVKGICRFCDQPVRDGEAETCYAHCEFDPQGEGGHNADFRQEQEDSFVTEDNAGLKVFDTHIACEYCHQISIVSLPVEVPELTWQVVRDKYGDPVAYEYDGPLHAHVPDYEAFKVDTKLDSYSNARTTATFPCTNPDCIFEGVAEKGYNCWSLEW